MGNYSERRLFSNPDQFLVFCSLTNPYNKIRLFSQRLHQILIIENPDPQTHDRPSEEEFLLSMTDTIRHPRINRSQWKFHALSILIKLKNSYWTRPSKSWKT